MRAMNFKEKPDAERRGRLGGRHQVFGTEEAGPSVDVPHFVRRQHPPKAAIRDILVQSSTGIAILRSSEIRIVGLVAKFSELPQGILNYPSVDVRQRINVLAAVNEVHRVSRAKA
jgi:hypothetical protein